MPLGEYSREKPLKRGALRQQGGVEKDTVKRAGLGKLTFHDLRHNFATELVQKGADLRTVQAYLGHSTLLMVQRYAHVTEGIRRSTIQLLGWEYPPEGATIRLQSKDHAEAGP